MENTLGFAHFLFNSDGIARFILVVMLLMSIGTWYLIATKGVRLYFAQQRSAAFLQGFWKADILSLIAASITFWVVNVRRRWFAEELVEIETLREVTV